MKNIYTYISVAAVTLMMMVASAFLLTAADAPVREAGGYVTLFFGVLTAWAVTKALLAEREREIHSDPARGRARAVFQN